MLTVRLSGESVVTVARKRSISQLLLYRWIKEYKAPGYSMNLENEQIKDVEIKQLVLELVKNEGYNYGYRKISYFLKRRHKLIINKKKVYRLCKELNILRPPWERKNKHTRRIERNRVVTKPDQLWQTDVKYGYIAGEDRLFYVLSFIDVFDRTIVGYHIGLNCVAKSAVSALKQSMLKRDPYGKEHQLIVRSDNGVQFTSIAFAEA
jgi:putative transposase